MGLLDGLVGGAMGAAATTAVEHLIQQHGGLGGMLAQLQSQGLGPAVQSWVSNGPNQPVTADQVHNAFGADMMAQIAAKVGMNPADLSQKLAQILPQAVNHLTPAGVAPPAA